MTGDDDLYRYDVMVEGALRGVVRESLRQAAEHGLTGNHHFYITFRTTDEDVGLPEYLIGRYPEEMTIVLQFQFWGLEVGEDGFAVTLSFNDVHERLEIPFSSISAFADPSVNFGLQFQTRTIGADGEESGEQLPALPGGPPAAGLGPRLDEEPDEAGEPAAETEEPTGDEDGKEGGGDGNVVTLDTFRKKGS